MSLLATEHASRGGLLCSAESRSHDPNLKLKARKWLLLPIYHSLRRKVVRRGERQRESARKLAYCLPSSGLSLTLFPKELFHSPDYRMSTSHKNPSRRKRMRHMYWRGSLRGQDYLLRLYCPILVTSEANQLVFFFHLSQ
jgi:hypothetical protein